MSGSDFWSRRRAAVAAQEAAERDAEDAARATAAEAELAARSDEEILAEHNLPDPDTLTSSEEVRAFLSEALPQRLKARALRQLWRLNPVLANVDGLVDYGEDFTDSAMVIEKMQTAYQVGKGMLRHVEAQAEAAAQEGTPETEAEAETPVAPSEPETAIITQTDMPDETGSGPGDTAPDMRDDETFASAPDPSRRRMRFQFEVQT